MSMRSIFEWWRSKNGRGYYHELRGRNIVTTSQRYTRARDAKRAAYRHARRAGGSVRERPSQKTR